MFGYIYETKNNINGKTYIGKKEGTFNKSYYGSGLILKQAIKKYGIENFTVTMLSTHETEDVLNRSEVEYIATRKPAYNIAEGGNGGNTLRYANKEYKDNVVKTRAESLSKTWNDISPEKRKQWGDNISRSKKGRTNGREGCKHSEETRIKMSTAQKGKKMSSERYMVHCEAMKLRRGKKAPNRKKIKVDGIVYESRKDAAEALGLTPSAVSYKVKNGKAEYI